MKNEFITKGYIYCISNTENNKLYIGKTESSINKRFGEHLRDSRKETNSNRPLYRAIRKYGEDKFSIRLVEECDVSILSEREVYWINFYNTYKNGYNATLGGDGKSYINKENIIYLWKANNNIKQIHEITGHDKERIADILKNSGISAEEIIKRRDENNGKAIVMLDLKTNKRIKKFTSQYLAAEYLINNGLTNTDTKSAGSSICKVCNNKRSAYLGYGWKYA